MGAGSGFSGFLTAKNINAPTIEKAPMMKVKPLTPRSSTTKAAMTLPMI